MTFRPMAAGIAGLMTLAVACAAGTHAEPAQDAVATIRDLSQQAGQLTESIYAAQNDLDNKLRWQHDAETRHAQDLTALGAADAELAVHQGAVDALASAVYMGGTTDSVNSLLTAESPRGLIDKLVVQHAMATDAAGQMQSFRQVSQQARTAAEASAKSAADAKAAAEAAAAVRADLQRKQSALQTKVAEVKVRYGLLTPAEQALLGPGAAVPTVGMRGLVPNALALTAYIIANYPGVQTIGGVRADPLPDHPSGHAIDIMIGSDMELGDAINADIRNQSARFGVAYTMWRVANHFNHVHVTVS